MYRLDTCFWQVFDSLMGSYAFIVGFTFCRWQVFYPTLDFLSMCFFVNCPSRSRKPSIDQQDCSMKPALSFGFDTSPVVSTGSHLDPPNAGPMSQKKQTGHLECSHFTHDQSSPRLSNRHLQHTQQSIVGSVGLDFLRITAAGPPYSLL